MKATVTKVFVDVDNKQHEIGEVVDFSEKRINALCNLGIVEVVADVADKATTPKRKAGSKNARKSEISSKS